MRLFLVAPLIDLRPVLASPDNAAAWTPRTSCVQGVWRLEGQYYRADVLQVEDLVSSAGIGVQPLADLVKSVTMSNRFKRYFGTNGTPYRSANELFDVNPRVTKRIYAGLLKHPEKYMLRAGELVMAPFRPDLRAAGSNAGSQREPRGHFRQ